MKILYCNVAPMEKYQGVELGAKRKGGKYIEEHGIGYELYNFKEVDGYYYGFVQPTPGAMKISPDSIEQDKFKLAKIKLERVDGDSNSSFIDGVTVIWVSKAKQSGRQIIGWYKNARVFRNQQISSHTTRKFKFSDGRQDYAGYYMVCKVDEGFLLPKEKRTFELPKRDLGGMGQSNVWYGNDEFDKRVLEYIEDYNYYEIFDFERLARRIDREVLSYPQEYRESVRKERIGQSEFRNALLSKFNCKCVLCNVDDKEVLIASHIKEWSKCEKGEHLDLNNGFIMCPNHDKLFDRHLISFNLGGNIVISKALSSKTKIFMNVREDMKIEITDKNRRYLKYHYDEFIKGNM